MWKDIFIIIKKKKKETSTLVGVFLLPNFRRSIMAYNGYLIKIKAKNNNQSDYIIPKKYIRAETYSVLRSGQDLDSYRDNNGDLQRTALNNFLYKVEFETPALLTNTQIETLMSNIRDRYIDSVEKKVQVQLYVPELNAYKTQKCYVPDITFQMYLADDNIIKYNQIRFAFIGYGKNG